jgi:hypothetical protein
MILQPLCASVDLGDAVAFAKKEYNRLAIGARPSICALPYNGNTDLLLCRFVLNFTPEADLIQILALQQHLEVESDGGAVTGGESAATGILTQTITILLDQWDKEGIHDTPFYAHTYHGIEPDALFEDDTGILSGFGGGSGNPVVLTSSDTSVCSVSGFNITVEGPGTVYFTLSQAGNEDYSAAPTLTGGTHIFPWYGTFSGGAVTGGVAGGDAQFEANAERTVRSDGGAVAGGEGTIAVISLLLDSFTAEGGGVTAGEMVEVLVSVLVDDFTSVGGARAGGASTVSVVSVTVSSQGAAGGAVAGGAAQFEMNALRYVNGYGGAIGGGASSSAGVNLRVASMSASGGARTGGVATVTRTPVQRGTMTGAGGTRAGGAVTEKVWFTITASGGGVAGGAAQFESNANRFMQGSGGVVAGYEARITQYNVRDGSMTASGGARASGVSTFTPIFVSRGSMTAVGGARASGVSTIRPWRKFTASGGAVVSGVAGESFTLLIYQFTAAGGGVVGGSVASSGNRKVDGSGGAVVSGVAVETLGAVVKPLAMQNIALTFPYKDLDTGFITLNFNTTGTAKRGGVLTYTILGDTDNLYFVAGVGTNGLPNYKMYKFDHYWLGNDTFSYKVTETTEDDVAIDSDVATVLVNAAAPATMAYTIEAVAGITDKRIVWTGGAAVFTLALGGTYTGIMLSVTAVGAGVSKNVIVFKLAGASTVNGYVRITDHYGSYIDILLSSLGVPVAALPTLVCSFVVGTTSLNVGGTTPITNISLDPRVSNGYTMFSSNTAIARVESNNTLVRGIGNGSCQIILKQFGIVGQYIDGRHEKTFTAGPGQPTPPTPGTGGWQIVRDWPCEVWGTPYLYSPYNVTASPNGQYRLTWAVIRDEYKGQGGLGTSGHDPRTFATYLGATMAFVYSNYFWGYSYSEENPESNGWIHIRYWEKFG